MYVAGMVLWVAILRCTVHCRRVRIGLLRVPLSQSSYCEFYYLIHVIKCHSHVLGSIPASATVFEVIRSGS